MCLKLVRCVLLLDDPGSSVIFLGENPSFAKAFVKSADGFVQKWRIERNFWWPSNNRNHDQQQLDGGNSRIFFSRLCNESNIGPRSQVTSYPHVLWQTRKKNRLSNLLQVYRPSPCAASALISSASLAGAEGKSVYWQINDWIPGRWQTLDCRASRFDISSSKC